VVTIRGLGEVMAGGQLVPDGAIGLGRVHRRTSLTFLLWPAEGLVQSNCIWRRSTLTWRSTAQDRESEPANPDLGGSHSGRATTYQPSLPEQAIRQRNGADGIGYLVDFRVLPN
jgi:hypothetical protein